MARVHPWVDVHAPVSDHDRTVINLSIVVCVYADGLNGSAPAHDSWLSAQLASEPVLLSQLSVQPGRAD